MLKLSHISLVLLLCLCCSPAAAQSKADARRALKLYKEGQALYRKGSYREAVEKYKQSQQAFPKRQTLYYWAESHRRLGQIRQSHGVYARYMEMLPAGQRATFGKKLESLRWKSRCVLSVATLPGGATVKLHGLPRGKTPGDGVPLKLEVPGGQHELSVELAGHQPASRRVTAEFGEPQALSFVLKPEALVVKPTAAPGSKPGPAPPASTPPAPTPPAPTPPASQPALPASQPLDDNPNRVFFTLFGGPYWAMYGDDTLSMVTAPMFALRLGYLWRWKRIGLHLDVSAMVQPRAEADTDDTSWMLSFMGGGGLRYYLLEALWIGPRLSLGISTLHGANPASLLFDPMMAVEGSFSGFLMRPEVVLGWTVWRGLTLTLVPLALDYTPRHSNYLESIRHLIRIQVALGLGWQW